jgi:hypothetical protein
VRPPFVVVVVAAAVVIVGTRRCDGHVGSQVRACVYEMESTVTQRIEKGAMCDRSCVLWYRPQSH